MADDADSPDLVAPPPAQEDGSAPPAPAPREGRPDLSDLPPGALMAARSALKYGVDPQVAIALAKHESGFNPNAIGVPTKSGERARGLFQVMPATAAGYGYDVNKMTPQDLADLGMKNFKIALDKHDGSYPHALAEHLGGPNAIAQDGSIRGDISDAMGSTPAGFAHSVLATAQRPDLMAGYQAQGAADVNSAMGASDQPDDGSGMDPRTKAAFDEYNANIVPPPPPPTFYPPSQQKAATKPDTELKPENAWKTPIAFRVFVDKGRVAEWRVYADNEPIRELMRKSRD